MEIQLQELIDQIKKDGVEAAESKAEAIINSAKTEADKIISDAKMQAEKIIESAKTERARITEASEDAIRQAGRNMLISFRQSVANQINAIISAKVSTACSGDKLAELITVAVERWIKNSDAAGITVLLAEDELAQLEGSLLTALKEKFADGVTLKAANSFDGGFRIATDNSGTFYDYSKEAVIEMLSNYLSPRVTELLKEAQ